MTKIFLKINKIFLTIALVFGILQERVKNRIVVCGGGSVVERHLAKVDVAGSNPVLRSNLLWEYSSVG